MRTLLLVLFATACAAAQSVEGTVFDAASGTPVAGVKVELLKQTTPFYETLTDGGGRFRFQIPEGDYSIRYQSPDYFLTAGPTDYRAFHVAAGDAVVRDMRMMPWSKISGRVVDGRGNPIPNALLEISGFGMTINGRTYLRTAEAGGGGGQLSDAPTSMSFPRPLKSDARGNFEARMMPGAYRIAVDAPPDLDAPKGLAWRRTYYPGVVSRDAAAKVIAAPGAEASGVEIKLQAVPTRIVRGIVLNPDGTPASKVKISAGDPPRVSTTTSRENGEFVFDALAEGTWRVATEQRTGEPRWNATEWIEVGAHDLENLKLRLAAPVTVRGRVIKDPDDGARIPSPMLLERRGGPESDGLPGPGTAVPITADARGAFVLQVYPGAWRLGPPMQPPPAPYYLDSILVGDADILRGDVEIQSDTTMTAIYKSDGGSVSGVAENCASGGVLLVPQDPAMQRRGFSRSGPCDASGRYQVQAVRPGAYYVLAFAGNGPVVTVDEGMLKQAARVTVRSRETATVDVKAVTRPIY